VDAGDGGVANHGSKGVDMKSAGTFEEMLKEGALAGGQTLTACGAAMIVIGALAILAPLATGIVFDMVFGALLIGIGIVEFVEALRTGTWQRGVLLGLAGVLALATGLFTIARPLVSAR